MMPTDRDLISRKTALASIKLNAMLRVQDIYEAIEAQPGTRLEMEDKDHIWLNGIQYVSLRRAMEMVKEGREQ